MFKEKEKKVMNKRIELKLKRNTTELLTSWEISDFIAKLSSSYYKNELVRTISMAINEGISPENIFIINQSYNYNTSYKYLENVNSLDLYNPSAFKRFFYLGYPISMFPNHDIFCISVCFNFFREINTYLGKIRANKISREDLMDLMDIIDIEDVEEVLTSLVRTAHVLIQKRDLTQSEYELFISNIDWIYNKYITQIKDYKKDSIYFDGLKKEILDGKISSIPSDEYNNNIEKTYFSKFFNSLYDLERPVVGIYYKESNQVQILCNSYITKRTTDARFLDIKEISHNSPFFVNLFIGVAVAIPIAIMAKNVIANYNNDRRMKQVSEKEQENIKNLEQILEQLDEFKETNEAKALEEINNKYIKTNMKELNSRVEEKLIEPIEKYKFKNANMQVNVLDFEENRRRIIRKRRPLTDTPS